MQDQKEGKSIRSQYAYIFMKRFCDEFDLCRSVRLELIPRPENFPINSNRFLLVQYANEDRLKIALSSISNGALVCLTCVASNSIVKRQTLRDLRVRVDISAVRYSTSIHDRMA
ncbi:hypothetical protein Tsp_10601 [Trichinella spiralis]|uniref:hypothetical protein n=1 Tax=Trichinella spiralis TaxID=6334 RepID=UPI0001EFD9BA|nr:hypothetical protein Tsp_10601 [Trichinella spiralis]